MLLDVKEPMELGDGVGAGLAGLPGCGWDRDDEAVGLSAAEADVQVDAIGLVQGDVVDQQGGPCVCGRAAGYLGWSRVRGNLLPGHGFGP